MARIRDALCLLTFASSLLGSIYRIVLSILDGFPVRVFWYFTVQSNLVVVMFLGLCVWSATRARGHERLERFLTRSRDAVLVYILVTALVYNILLAPDIVDSGYSAFILVVNHTVTPILFLLYWLVAARPEAPRLHDVVLWLVYPLVYAVFASIHGSVTGQFLYFFLDYINYSPPQYLISMSSVVGGFILVALAIHTLDAVIYNRTRKRSRKYMQIKTADEASHR